MPKSINELLNYLKDDKWYARWYAAMSLGETGDTNAVASLVECLTDEHHLVRLDAAKALNKLGWTPGNDVEKANYLAANREWDELEKLGQVAIEPLIRILRDENGEVGEPAKQSIVRIREPAMEPLIHALGDENDHARECAADALGDINDNRAVEPLISALSDGNFFVQRKAAISLGKLKDSRAVVPLIKLLRDKRRYIVEAACWALKEIGEAAVQPLVGALIEGRVAAAEALVMMGRPAVQPLIQLLKRRDVGRIAAEALAMIGDKRAIKPLTAVLHNRDADEEFRKAVENALDSIKKGIKYPPLID